MKKINWDSNSHPISDIRDWNDLHRFKLRPDFQRRYLWTPAAKIMLMDSILCNIPMPKIFVHSYLVEESDKQHTYRTVIDGQQRITAILEFMQGKYKLGHPLPDSNKYFGMKYSDFDNETRARFLNYKIDFNELKDVDEFQIREVYTRVNKYNAVLNKQEIRKAEFPGDFLQISEALSGDSYFESERIFTPGNIRRSLDVEFISELLIVMLSEYKDKKENLDEFYYKFQHWSVKDQNVITKRFKNSLNEFKIIFDESLPIAKTRYRQKSDFYTLFLVFDDLLNNSSSIKGKDLQPLRHDLKIINDNVRPSSEIEIFSDYAMRCVSKTNSASSRRWRHAFIKSILLGTYTNQLVSGDSARLIYRIHDQIVENPSANYQGYLPSACDICNESIKEPKKCILAWSKSTNSKQISNAIWLHKKCIPSNHSWCILERPKDGKRDLFES